MTLGLEAYAIGQWAGYTPSAHHLALIQRLEDVASGKCKRLMVFMPPRHGKSMLASEYFPAWYLGMHPDHQVIAATYSQGLADDFGRKVRNLVTSEAHRWVFHDFLMSDDSQAANRFHTSTNGAYFAVGAGGPITGRGAHLLLIDDPIKGREDAESETMRQRLKDWYTSVARTRLMPGGAIVVIQTRWHSDDLSGWLLRKHQHEGWEVLNLPAIAEPNDQIGRAEGDPLWPTAYSLGELSQIKQSIGSRDWAALYQQRPSAAEGSIFKREHWQYFTPTETNPKALVASIKAIRLIQAWDTAFKTHETNDYSVGVTIGVTQSRYYILDVWRERCEFPDLKRALVAQAAKWGPHMVVVEDTAAGQSLIQELRRDTRLPLVAVKADRDKVSRANAITAIHEAGLVYLPEGEHWLSDFVDELAGFPTAPHDDQVDAFVHGMAQARMVGGRDAGESVDPTDLDAIMRHRARNGGGGTTWMG